MNEHDRQIGLFRFLIVAMTVLAPSASLACTVSYNPEKSTDKVVTFDVRLKPGERCALPGDGQDAARFRRGEKTILNKGSYGRLNLELANRRNSRRAHWQYVYAAPKRWTGYDTVGISYSMPGVDNTFNIAVEP